MEEHNDLNRNENAQECKNNHTNWYKTPDYEYWKRCCSDCVYGSGYPRFCERRMIPITPDQQACRIYQEIDYYSMF